MMVQIGTKACSYAMINLQLC